MSPLERPHRFKFWTLDLDAAGGAFMETVDTLGHATQLKVAKLESVIPASQPISFSASWSAMM